MTQRQITLLTVAALMAGLFFVFSPLESDVKAPLDDSTLENKDTDVANAANISEAEIDLLRDTTSAILEPAINNGQASVEFYFHSEMIIENGEITINGESHSFKGNYFKLSDIAAEDYAINVAVQNHLQHKQRFQLEKDQDLSIDVYLDRAAILKGRVINHQGNPVAGAIVAGLEDVVDDSLYALALASFFNYGNLPDWIADETVTDDNGYFEMSNLKLAKFNVLVTHNDYLPLKTEIATDLETNPSITLEPLVVQKGVSLKLIVSDQSQAAITTAEAQWRPNSLLAKTVISRNDEVPTFNADDTGIIEIHALPSDILSVNVNADGFAEHVVEVDLSGSTAGETQTHQIMLTTGVRLSGLVLNTDGKPCPESTVALMTGADFSIEAAVTGNLPLQSTVDSDGNYFFNDLASKQYYLIATAEGYSRQVVGPFSIGDQDIANFDITMQHGAKLIITVLDSEDVPLANTIVTAVSVKASNFDRGRTDEQGMLTLSNLTAGDYQVSSVDTTSDDSADVQFEFVTLSDGEVRELTLGGIIPTATLSGTITLADVAVHRARVSVITSSGAKVASTNKDGLYTIPDMPLGDFVLIVNVTSGLNGNSAFYDSVLISSEGELTHDIALPNAGLEVHVTSSADGSIVQSVPVAVRPLNGTNISGGDFGLTDASGVAKFPSLNDGEYMVSVGTAAASFISPQDNGLGSKIISGIHIKDGMGVERLDIALSQGATVKVQVSDQNGNLLANAHMHYLDANGQPMNIISLGGTNAKGVAQLKGLPSGPGRIMVRHPDLGMSEFEVNLSDGEMHKQKVILESGTKLMVTVVDENDLPLSGVLCTALDHRGAALSYVWAISETQATQSAYFSGTAQKLGPLPVGNYKIQLIRPGKKIDIHDVFVNGESVQNLRLRFNEE